MWWIYSEENEEIGAILPQNPPRKRHKSGRVFFALLVCFTTLIPVYPLYGAIIGNQNTISVNAVVPFNWIFAEAVAKNSTITSENTIVFSGQDLKITTVFSNGETNFKNEGFICDLIDKNGTIKFSYQGKTGENRMGKFTVPISTEMVGKNNIQCRTTGYEQNISIKHKKIIFVLPRVKDTLSFLY